MSGLRMKLYLQLVPEAWEGRGISPVNWLVLGLVLASIVAAVLQSEPAISRANPGLFLGLNWFFALTFTFEYAVRLAVIGNNPHFAGFGGRLRYARTVSSVLDVVATGAIWLDIFFGIPGVTGVILRLARALRVITLTRNSSIGIAVRLLRDSIVDRSTELLLSLVLSTLVLLVASVLLFFAEGAVQPEAFGSIPRAMWWAVATLTTVGYGDVYPVTATGRFLAGLTALTSIALVSMPAGIMAAAFSKTFQDLRRSRFE